tara:strand:- start:8111 stop:9040 length:930 start_codon:yes stop_codon:yes gene_type:complete
MGSLITSATPLRISFIGGGTDFKEFYEKKDCFGMVISTAINLKTYCFFKEKNNLNLKIDKFFFDNDFQSTNIYKKFISFCRRNKIKKKYDVIFYCDIPNGSGLGTSSSYILSLLKAFYQENKIKINKSKIIEQSNYFESKMLKRPIGMQDAWGSEINGIKKITFKKKKISFIKINNLKFISFVNNKLFLYPVNYFVSNDLILKNIKKNINKNIKILQSMNSLTQQAYRAIKFNKFEYFLEILRKSHDLKSKYTNGVTNKKIENLFSFLIKKKMRPLKILGAGGRGYILFYCKNKKNLKKLNYLDFKVYR